MNSLSKQLYSDCFAAFKNIYEQITVLRRATVKQVCVEEIADTAFAVREAHKYLEECCKELVGLQKIAEKLVCNIWVKTDVNGEPVRTEYVTATPRVREMTRLPNLKRDPEDYAKLMKALGFSDYVTAEGAELVRPHYPGIVDHVSELLHEGKSLPDGLDEKTLYTVFSLLYRKKKEIME